MLSEPGYISREAQPFAAIRLVVAQTDIPHQAPPLHDRVAAWLAAQGVKPTGAPFFNYTRMGELMEMEVGWPTATVPTAEGEVITGTLPAGRYVAVRYTGPYEGLYEAHTQLHEWLERQGAAPEHFNSATGRSTLLEIYETDPADEPDPGKWVTDIAFKLPG